MVHFIAYETGPSQLTLEKIAFINRLNASGMNATLYGINQWPKDKCKYDSLRNFKIENNSIIIADSIKVESSFDLVNIDRYTYTHGRKQRVLDYFIFIKKYLTYLLSFKFNYKIVCYRPHNLQQNFSIFSANLHNNIEMNLSNLSNDIASFEFQNKLYIMADISELNKIFELISNSHFNEIVLAGAIVEPFYFKEKIIPLMNDQKKKISIIGFKEDLSFAQIDRTKPSSEKNASQTMKQWDSLLMKLK